MFLVQTKFHLQAMCYPRTVSYRIPTKLLQLKKIQTPALFTEVKSFLGMTNFCNCCIPNYSTEPLRNLTRKDIRFTWNTHRQEAFNTLKSSLKNEATMVFSNPHATTKIITDANLVGFGAILTQKQENGKYNPAVYVSRSSTSIESRYSQTEKEALAVTWSFLLLYIWPTYYNHNWP